MALPRVDSADYDGDDKEELAVVLLAYTGTGVSREQLFMLEKQADDSWTAAEDTQYLEQIETEVACTWEEAAGLLSLRDIPQGRLIGEMDLTALMDETAVYDDTYFGDIVSFVLKDDEIPDTLAAHVMKTGRGGKFFFKK